LIAERADRCIGIDIDEQSVEIAREAGFDVRLADAQSFDFDTTFDTIVATNVIEHLSRPGAMLERAREHLAPGGRLLITTPRTHVPWNLARELAGGITTAEEHVMWYCEDTLRSILKREGFRVTNYQTWTWPRSGDRFHQSAFLWAMRVLDTVPLFDGVSEYQHFVIAVPQAYQ
jgi:2-polyprenyl-3-methyl-5-hydroxy-6-metoxy-1,4-benzoquinol methylase